MSRNEWERGELTFGAKEFPIFRKGLIDALNVHQAAKLKLAIEIHADLMATAKAEADLSLPQRLAKRSEARRVKASTFYRSSPPAFDLDDDWAIEQALTGKSKGEPRRLVRPSPSHPSFRAQPLPAVGEPSRPFVRTANATKKNLYTVARDLYAKLKDDTSDQPLTKKFEAQWRLLNGAVPSNAYAILLEAVVPSKPPRLVYPTAKSIPPYKSSAVQFDGDGCTLSLDAKSRKAFWHVDTNNHAVEHAWESVLGVTFDRLLKGTAWPRGTGGRFWGGDEYHDDANEENGGGESSYTTRTYPTPPVVASRPYPIIRTRSPFSLG